MDEDWLDNEVQEIQERFEITEESFKPFLIGYIKRKINEEKENNI